MSSGGQPGDRRGALAGLRVIEIGGIGPAPFAAMILADLGAEVIRIDRPHPGTKSLVNKRNRAAIFNCDLKDPAARQSVIDLVNSADVLIEGFRPGVMERLGLGPAVFVETNPRLIYGRMTGWGQTGPLASTAGHDLNYIAATGALAAIGTAESPIPPLNLVGDYAGGSMFLLTGILAALFERDRSGLGQVIDAAMTDGSALMMTVFYARFASGNWLPERAANELDGGAPYYATYRCADGKHIAVAALEDQFYRRLVALVPDAEQGLTDRTARESWPQLRKNLAAIFAMRTRDEWQELLENEDVCVSPVLSLDEAPLHPHNEARETFVVVEGITQPAPAPRFSRTPSREVWAGPDEDDRRSILERWGVESGPLWEGAE